MTYVHIANIIQYEHGDIAQLVEHFHGMEGVWGSNPHISTNKIKTMKFKTGLEQKDRDRAKEKENKLSFFQKDDTSSSKD